MDNCFYYILSWRIWPILRSIDPDGMGAVYDLLQLTLIDWADGDWQDQSKLEKHMEEHCNHIRRIVPRENLLEFNPKEGWGPLCEFLGKDVPKSDFPHVNKGGNAANIIKVAIAIKLVKLSVKPLTMGLGLWLALWLAMGS